MNAACTSLRLKELDLVTAYDGFPGTSAKPAAPENVELLYNIG